MGLFDEAEYVSRKELMAETGIANATIAKYLQDLGLHGKPVPREKKQELIEYIKQRVSKSKKLSAEALARGRQTILNGRRFEDAPHDWRVSIRGSYGWIVVRTGTREEMEPWAEMLMRNGIEARASKNRHGR